MSGLYLSASEIPGAGQGVFAATDLPEGYRLPVSGIVMERGSVRDVCTHASDAYKFRWKGKLILPLDLAGMVNHSPKPNMRVGEVEGVLCLVAIHPIEAGQELTHRYGPDALKYFGEATDAKKTQTPASPAAD